MIDINELRRLAQAALAGPDGISLNWIKLIQDFQQNAGPATILELLDRLEAAEKERDALQAKIEAMERQRPEPAARIVGEIGEWVSNGEGTYSLGGRLDAFVPLRNGTLLYALPGAQQCKNCNGMGDRFDQSGEKIPCDLCESHLEEIRSLVAEAAHDIISGSDFWLSINLAAKKIYAIPGAKVGEPAPSVPEDVMRDAGRYRYLRARDDGTAGVGCWIEADGRVCDRGWLYGVQLDSAIDSFIEVLAAAPKPEVKP